MALTLRIFGKLLPLAAALLLACPCVPSPASERSPSLFAQAAQSTLDREFPSGAVSYLLLDAHSGEILAERWPNADTPIPIGSLIKPFTALAYEQARRPFPAVVCHGRRDLCWLPAGHGSMTLEAAIAQSCNAYFLSLAQRVSVEQANTVLGAYALPPVNAASKSYALVGLSSDWQVAPLILARAYAQLAKNTNRERNAEIFAGMRQSAQAGTARAISLALPGASALAKTGTAHCTHTPRATADGFTVVLFPADDPRIVLLTRVHGVTGAAAASTAAQMLCAIEAGQQ
jgi:hypothetical protein